MSEYGQQPKNIIHFVLLDWEKAFDKIDRKALVASLYKLGLHPRLIKLVQSVLSVLPKSTTSFRSFKRSLD